MQILAGILLEATDGQLAARRDRHGALAARVARGARSRATARSCCRAGCSSTSRGCCRRTRCTIEHRAGGGASCTSTAGCGELPAATRTTSEDFPRLPGGRRGADVRGRPRGAARDDRAASQRVGLPRRVAPGADRHPRPLRAGGKLVMAATDSYRLVGEGDGARAARRRSSRRSSRRARCRSSQRIARRGRRARARRAREPGRVRAPAASWLTTRRIDGQFPNYSQLLPEAFEHELTLPRDELLDVVRRVAVMVAAQRRRSGCASPRAS